MEEPRGIGVRDVKPADFIAAYAQHLKNSGKMDLPRNWEVVKTATFKELAPYSADWYYIRAASIARKVYLRQNTGIGALRRVYGGPARRNTTLPVHFQRGSGKMIRTMCQQLEAMGVLETVEDGKGGRRITEKGQQDLDRIAGQVAARS